MYYRLSNSSPISLIHKIAVGGEGEIWQTQIPNLVAKIFHPRSLSSSLFDKLACMMHSPPSNLAGTEHLSIAWPQDILVDATKEKHGFLMEKVPGSLSLSQVYSPKLRKKLAPNFNWFYLHTTAYNLAIILKALHAHSYIVGDLKTDNFLVTNTALVSAIDTNSFQVANGKNYFLCPVGSEGFTPPELIGVELTQTPRTELHDRFGLGVIIHLLLLGYHPFRPPQNQLDQTLDQCVQAGQFSPGSDSLQTYIFQKDLHPALQKAFFQTFVDGHMHPEKRLNPSEWAHVLEMALEHLATCDANANHFFDDHHASCRWCQKEKQFGFTIFPGKAEHTKAVQLQQLRKGLRENNYRILAHFSQENPELVDYELSRNPLLKERFEQACLYAEEIEKFKKFCKEALSSEDILNYWDQTWVFQRFTPLEIDLIKNVPLATFIERIRTEVEENKELKKIITIAQVFQETHQRIDTYLEEEILGKAKNSSEKLLEHYKDRIKTAQMNIFLFKKISDLIKKQDFLGLYHLDPHELEHAQKFDWASSSQDFLSTYDAYKKTLDLFNSYYHQQKKEDEILELWGFHKDFQKSNLILAKVTETLSLVDWIRDLEQKKASLSALEKALSQKDYLTIYQLWDKRFNDDPEFALFKPFLEQGKTLQENWPKVRRFLLEEQAEELVSVWHDIFFPLVKQENLAEKLRTCFVEAFKELEFPCSFFNRVNFIEEKLYIFWASPLHKAPPLYWISCRTDRFPLHPGDVVDSCHSSTYTPQHPRCFFSLSWHSPSCYVAIWPALKVTQEPVILSAPLKLSNAYSPLLLRYTLKPEKRLFQQHTSCKVSLLVEADRDLLLPEAEIIGLPERLPLDFEPHPPVLACIPKINLIKNSPHSISISLKEAIPHDHLRLVPKDRKLLNQIQFQIALNV